jgi:hypothetical protein
MRRPSPVDSDEDRPAPRCSVTTELGASRTKRDREISKMTTMPPARPRHDWPAKPFKQGPKLGPELGPTVRY